MRTLLRSQCFVKHDRKLMILFLIAIAIGIITSSSIHLNRIVITDDYPPSDVAEFPRGIENENHIREVIIQEYNNKIYQHVAGTISIFLAFFSFRKTNYFVDLLSYFWQKIAIVLVFWLLVFGLIYFLGRLNFWIIRAGIINSQILHYKRENIDRLPEIEIMKRAIENKFRNKSFAYDNWRNKLALTFHESLMFPSLGSLGIIWIFLIAWIFISIFHSYIIFCRSERYRKSLSSFSRPRKTLIST